MRRIRVQAVRNGATTVAGNAWALVVGAVTLPVALHGLGREQFGIWVLIQTLSAVNGWLSLADLGLRTAAVRAIADPLARADQATADRVAGSTVRVLAVVGASASLLLLTLGRSVFPTLFGVRAELRAACSVALAWFALQVLLELLLIGRQCLLEGSQRIDIARGVHALRQTLVGGAVAVVAVTTQDVRAVAAASATATAVALVAASLAVRRRALVRPRAPSRADARHLLGYGLQIGAINATGVLHRTMDRVIVGAIYGPSAVVLIEIATQIANGAQTMLTTSHAITSAAPWLHARAEPDRLRALLVRGTKLTLLASAPALAIAAVLASPIVTIWMGAEYREDAGLAAMAVLGVALAAPAQASSLILQGTGRARAVLVPATVAVFANLALSIGLARLFGLVGVFVATVITAAGLLVPLVGHALRATATGASEFVRRAIRPAGIPAFAAAGGAGLGLLAGPAWAELSVGATAGVVFWAATTWAALDGDDRRALRGAADRDGTEERTTRSTAPA